MVAVPNLADYIEAYIKKLLSLSGNTIELQRKELALKFNCAPSQINYVLSTRFTPSRGYLVETRRGGGGYVRIAKMVFSREGVVKPIWNKMGDSLENKRALELLELLFEEKAITLRERNILRVTLSFFEEMEKKGELSPEKAKACRARLFRGILLALAAQ